MVGKVASAGPVVLRNMSHRIPEGNMTRCTAGRE